MFAYTAKEEKKQRQVFFKEALLPQVDTLLKLGMNKTKSMLSFQSIDFVALCKNKRDAYIVDQGKVYHIHSKEIRQQIHCQELSQLPVAKVGKKFANVDEVTTTVNSVIEKLNKYRAVMDELVRWEYEYHSTKGPAPHGGAIERVPVKKGTTKKVPFLQFFYVLNATDFSREERASAGPVITEDEKIASDDQGIILDKITIMQSYDRYLISLHEATQTGVLPLIFTQAMQQKTGGMHLNHKGTFFGFGPVRYPPLKLADKETVQKAIVELENKLAQRFIEVKKKMLTNEHTQDHEIFKWVLNNDIAIAQLIMQNPMHALVVTDLLNKFRNDPILPKWLRTFKKVALVADFAPLAMLGLAVPLGIATGGLLYLAIGANFLWMGAATAEAMVARSRMMVVENAIVTYTSQNSKRGIKLRSEYQRRKREAFLSVGAGGTLTVANTIGVVKNIPGLNSVMVDVTAGVLSESEIISGSSGNERTEADIIHNP